jgi:hypothetical protein
MNRALAAGVLAGLSAAVGCLSQPTNKSEPTTTSTSRSQAADDPADVPSVGRKTIVGNVESVTISGVGLVYGLKGTGSSPPPGELRATLENRILKEKGSPRELLDDPARGTSLVIVSATIPPGARANELIDVTVSLPPGSKTTSLKGGSLYRCDLSTSELAGNVRRGMVDSGVMKAKPSATPDGMVLAGSKMAVAEGPLVVGATDGKGDPAESPVVRAGKVWGGAKVLHDRPYYLLLTDGSPQPRQAMVIAERLNSTFHAAGDRSGRTAEAKVQGKPIVTVQVPPAYRKNHPRFLLVARQVPLFPVDGGSPYRQQLEHDLVRPETALAAAVKLEALGADSRQPLRVGLQSDSPWVRFAAAESLAYLGHPDGAKDLAELAESHPALRTHCLTALGSMDDGACLDLLAELTKKADPELRYGAFAALRAADPNHEAVRGRLLNRSLWLHAVADADPDRPTPVEPLIHISTDRRAEVVLFGGVCPVRGSVSIPLGAEFTVTGTGDGTVTVTRVKLDPDGNPVAVPAACRADLGAVLTALGQLGGTYPDAVELIRRLDAAGALAVPVAYDAVPRGYGLPTLAQMARTDPLLEKADADVARAGRPADAVAAASYNQNLPTDADAVQVKYEEPAGDEPALNRDPGRLFGPKRPGTPDEPASPLNKEPGRLFWPPATKK